MASWSRKRKFWIAAGVIAVLAVLVGVPAYFYFDRPPSCFDNTQNQGEQGIDCGGPCTAVCTAQVEDLIIHWQRVFSVAPGIVDVAALVENPNPEAGLEELVYRFKIYDKENLLIAEKFGKTFALPGEQFSIFQGGVRTGERKPRRVFFEFASDLSWSRLRVPEQERSSLSVRDQRLEETTAGKPLLVATLENDKPFPAKDISVVALLYDEAGNAQAASKTFVERVEALGGKRVSFTWQEQFEQVPTRIDIIPRINTYEE